MIKAKTNPVKRIQNLCSNIQLALKESGLTEPPLQEQKSDQRQNLYLSLKKQLNELSK